MNKVVSTDVQNNEEHYINVIRSLHHHVVNKLINNEN